MAERREYADGITWTFKRSDGSVKIYVKTVTGHHGSMVMTQDCQLREYTYDSKLIWYADEFGEEVVR